MYLARTPDGSSVTVAEVASQFDVPHNHLVKVVGAMAKLGWVDAVRGRNGGIRLAGNASDIRIGTVLRGLEGDSEAIDCEGIGCRLAGDCALRHALKCAVDAFYKTMDEYTLESIMNVGMGEQIIMMRRNFMLEQRMM
tara:strand:+ start:90532 stop:90945 length:414 start_codon:yes stop_codon:yes gene_type:complete